MLGSAVMCCIGESIRENFYGKKSQEVENGGGGRGNCTAGIEVGIKKQEEK